MNLDIGTLTQMAFSIGVSWYLLFTFAKKLEGLAKDIQSLSASITNTQKDSLSGAQEIKDMFAEIKNLIKETSGLVQTTSESVRVQNELTRYVLARLERVEETEQDVVSPHAALPLKVHRTLPKPPK